MLIIFCKNMSNNSNSKIAKNLKKLRRQKGISKDRLSKRADLSLNTIVNIESGVNPNPTIDTLTRIANGLEVEVEKLIK